MNKEDDRSDFHVESLVRDYLIDQERTVDASRMLNQVRQKLAAPGVSQPARSAICWSVVSAIAASLLIIVSWNVYQSPAKADPMTLVRDAQTALKTEPDRAYQIKFALAPGVAERHPFLATLLNPAFNARLWTRSDRFRIESSQPGRDWVCGRDEQGSVWIATGSGVGLVFQASEVPEPITQALDLFALDLPTLLELMLTDFDIDEPTSEPLPTGISRIRGRLKPNRPNARVRALTIDVENRTKLVRRVVLSRLRDGKPLAETSFVFEETRAQGDDRYRLSGHLPPNAPTFGADQPIRRRRQLARTFGAMFGD